MVNINLLQSKKQFPWKSFPIHKVLKDVPLESFQDISTEKNWFKVHSDDQSKVEMEYKLANPFKKPEQQFIELNTLRSKNDFASFHNLFDNNELCVLLTIKENQSLKHPIYITLPCTQKYQSFQYGINVQKNASVSIYETYQKGASDIHVHNASSFISVQENARLEFISENSKAAALMSIRHMHNYLYKNSQLYLNYYSVEDKQQSLPVNISSLYNVHTFLMGEAANFFEQALILAKNKKDRQHYSNIYHLQPYGQSSQLHKAMLDDSAKSVFNALVFIASNCPQVNSQQLNNNLSFSKKAKMISQPQLQVKTDDVKAAHGSTTGQVQSEELYYLQSRGIPLIKAKQLLKQAFIQEVQSQIHNHSIKESINIILEDYDA